MLTVMESPVGDLRIVERNGSIVAIEFSPFRPPSDGRPLGARDDDDPLLRETVRQLTAYFDRDLKEFDLPLAPEGSAFQQRVWAALLEVGWGETASYGQIAHRLGMTNAASRAVGLANGHSCDLPITQAEIADATGLSTVHVNRTLQELRADRLISLKGTWLDVLDWQRLKQAGDFDPAYLHLNERSAALV